MNRRLVPPYIDSDLPDQGALWAPSCPTCLGEGTVAVPADLGDPGDRAPCDTCRGSGIAPSFGCDPDEADQ